MNILINFRYLSTFGIHEAIINEVTSAIEIDYLAKDFQSVAGKIGKIITVDKIENDTSTLKFVKNKLVNAIDDRLNIYNDRFDRGSYLWLDEICTVSIKGKKAIPLENENEYADFEDLKSTIQKAISKIASKSDIVFDDNYHDIMFVVYLDIIEKDVGTFIIYPGNLK